MNELNQLYQSMILEHGKNPRNFYKLNPFDAHAEGFNPLCGDEISLYLRFDDSKNIILESSFTGHSCAIATASASLMTETLKNKSTQEAKSIGIHFIELLSGKKEGEENPSLGKLTSLLGVKAFPMRVKCATMCWHSLFQAIQIFEKPL